MTPLVPTNTDPWPGSFVGADQGLHFPAGPLVAVVPGDADAVAVGVAGARKDIMDDGVGGPVVLSRSGPFGTHRGRGRQGKGLEDRIVDVAAHVAERAGAEIEPAPPVRRMVVAGDVVAGRGDAEPPVPVERRRHRVLAVGPGIAVAPVLVAEGVHLADLADDAVLNEPDAQTILDVPSESECPSA